MQLYLDFFHLTLAPCSLALICPLRSQEWSAQQVRAKIRQFINSGEMKVGEFQKKIDVGSASYQRFMYQGGDAGAYSDTYVAAAEFFKKRQLAGIPISRKKVKADTTSDADANKNSNTKSSSKSAAATLDVSGIQLDGESSRRHVPIYDTCDDVRSKINRHLRATAGASNAGLVRAINAAVPAEDPISARHLTTLLKGSGATRGAESPAFYGAYVLFEKLRIKEGKPKTKKREEMEAAWGRGGMDRTDVSRGGIFAGPNDKPYINEYGQLKFAGRKW